MLRYFFILLFLINPAHAQSPVDYVNPFIGTGAYAGVSRWGAQGGTYPGAVVPHGMVQVSPETRQSASGRGYHYQDSTIQCFSFLDHPSGFPEGSAGRFKMMPVCDSAISSGFHHHDEMAQPGFYSVLLASGIKFECTATSHCGFCNIMFPAAKQAGLVFLDLSDSVARDQFSISGQCQDYYYTVQFNAPIQSVQQNGNQTILRFSPNGHLLCKSGFSARSVADAAANLQAEIPDWSFDATRKLARQNWEALLGQIKINGGTEQLKTVFYTALYHSYLLPMQISDCSEPEPRYNTFSPWDTYQTVHPLLTLLQPQLHGEMLASLVNESAQNGKFPGFAMAGNHIIAVLADAWAKGIRNFDLLKAYALVRNTMFDSSQSLAAYNRNGFVSADQANSVSITLANAYDDWAASELAGYAGRKVDQAYLAKRALNYRNLFNPSTRLMSAKSSSGEWMDHIGFEEGDAWDYTWGVPHNIKDLINLLGGNRPFAEHLQSHFAGGRYLHDNEPSLHYAYLFSYAGMPWKTQQWLRYIMDSKYSAHPGGMPGNDDLGSLSAWYVFSALGIYPVCPGRTQYIIGSPLFDTITMALADNKQLSIIAHKTQSADIYIKAVRWNGKPYLKNWLEHSDLTNGGTLEFFMTSRPDTTWGADETCLPPSLTKGGSHFEINNIIAAKSVAAGDSSAITLVVRNSGERGCHEIRLLADHACYSSHWILLGKNEARKLELPIVFYAPGTHEIAVAGKSISLQVIESPPKFKLTDTRCTPIVRHGTPVRVEATLRNIGGRKGETTLKICVDDLVSDRSTIHLQPGEIHHIERSLTLAPGVHRLKINDAAAHMVKVYQRNLDSDVLHLTFAEKQGLFVHDSSGLGNHAQCKGPVERISGKKNSGLKLSRETYIELPKSKSLNSFHKNLTMSIWLFPLDDSASDFFCQGDYNVLKTEDSGQGFPTLSFFAGGWGRGEAKYPIQNEWAHHWRHIAGVCDSTSIRLYLDGKLVANTAITGDIEASPFPWLIGRNAEKPGERRFLGFVDDARIFVKALDSTEVKALMLNKPEQLKEKLCH